VFFLIWGFKRYLTQLAMVTLVCGHCQRPSAHPVRKVVTKFTLFWIPLFPTSTKYVLQCTFCGFAQELPREEAERLAALPPAQPAPVEPQGGPQGEPQSQTLPSHYQDRAE
jgi:hypothetical protein